MYGLNLGLEIWNKETWLIAVIVTYMSPQVLGDSKIKNRNKA